MIKNSVLLFPAVHYFTWKLEFFLNILSMAENTCVGVSF